MSVLQFLSSIDRSYRLLREQRLSSHLANILVIIGVSLHIHTHLPGCWRGFSFASHSHCIWNFSSKKSMNRSWVVLIHKTRDSYWSQYRNTFLSPKQRIKWTVSTKDWSESSILCWPHSWSYSSSSRTKRTAYFCSEQLWPCFSCPVFPSYFWWTTYAVQSPKPLTNRFQFFTNISSKPKSI